MPPPSPSLHWRPWTLALTLVIGLGGSVAAGWLGYRAEAGRQRHQLEGEMVLRLERLRAGLQAHLVVLEAMGAHFELQPPKDDAGYEAYLQGLNPLGRFPGLQGVTLGLILTPADVAAREAQARQDRSLLPDGHPNFRLHPLPPAGRPGPVFMVRFVHPMATNAAALGFESASRPDQEEALSRALREGGLAATGPVQTAQAPTGAPGFVLRKVLRDPATKAPWGYLNTIWQPQSSLLLLQSRGDSMDLQLVDLGLPGQPESPRAFLGPDLAAGGEAFLRGRLDFGGRTLELRLRPKPGAHGFGRIWWPAALALTLGALTLLAAYRHWTVRSLATRIQEELERTESHLQTVLSSYPDLIVLFNADLTYRDVFTGRESLLLLPRDELHGRPLRGSLPEPLGLQVEEATRRLLDTGEVSSLEYDLELAAGLHHFEARGARLDAPDPAKRCAMWSIRDITARKQAEESLRQREEEFRTFFDSAPSPLLISGLEDGRILLANAALRRLMEYPAEEELHGTTPDYYVDPAQRDAIIARIRKEGCLRNAELTVRTRSGTLRQLAVSSDLIHMGGKQVLLSAFHDLTEQRSSEEALRQAQKLESLGLMAGGIAHDFNNLLAAIQGNLDLARLAEERRAQVEHVDAAAVALQRAADLTRQLLAYSGKTPLRTGLIDLGQLAAEMAALLRVSVSKRIELELAIPEGLPLIEGDRPQLQQVVLNLVTNAADAIASGPGRIEVRAGRLELEGLDPIPGQSLSPGPHVWLSVRDTGAGMTEEVKARIFDPFFTTKGQGRGLGLSAMQGILRAHHAGLQIESAPREGSTFILYFPALSPAVRPEPEAKAAATRPAFHGHVLLVDDEESLRKATTGVLELLGFEVRAAAGGREALGLLAEATPDLVILDLTMPLMDGTEVLSRLRQTHPSLPVILCSGYSSSAPLVMNGDPNLGFLAKPFTLAELRAELARRLPH